MGCVHELAHSAGVHTCPHPRLHELGASGADMGQHLVQPTPPLHENHT
jgi:hypothetical protein